MRGLALGGFMGSGKSTVGRLLAERLGMSFLDLDAELVARFGPISAQFQDVGEAGFRAREAKILAQFCGGPPLVMATGGGAWVSAINRETLAVWGDRVVLRARVETLRARVGVGAGEDRPLWGLEVEALFKARSEVYLDADLVLDTDDMRPEEVVRRILLWRSTR